MVLLQQYSWSMVAAWGALRWDLLLRIRVLALVLTLPSHCGQRNLIAPFLSGLPMGFHVYLSRLAYHLARFSPLRSLGGIKKYSGVHSTRKCRSGASVPVLRLRALS